MGKFTHQVECDQMPRRIKPLDAIPYDASKLVCRVMSYDVTYDGKVIGEIWPTADGEYWMMECAEKQLTANRRTGKYPTMLEAAHALMILVLQPAPAGAKEAK